MFNLSHLQIRAKLRIMSLVTLLCVLLLGFTSDYFFRTSEVIGLIINAERVHNNTFQEGVEDFYKSVETGQPAYIDSAILHMDAANQMAYNFGTIDQIMQLPKDKYTNILFDTYHLAYDNDRKNAALMATRINLFLTLNREKLADAQKVAMEGYLLGTQIRNKIFDIRKANSQVNSGSLDSDLRKMRIFYTGFAHAVSSLSDFANGLLFWGIFLIISTLLIVLWVISEIISRSITVPVATLVDNFKVIARGNLNSEIALRSGSEIGQLAASFREIQSGMYDIIDYTRKVADGDYSLQITPRSDEDELSIALNKMVLKLRDSYNQVEQDSWFKTGINQLNQTLSGDHHLEVLTTNALDFIMNFLHSQLGSIHLYNPEYQFLRRLASSGFDTSRLKEKIKLNEGIPGQVALKKEMIVLTDIPHGEYVTYSSSGSYHPKQVVVTPLIFNDNLIGVLELSSVSAYTGQEINYLKEAATIIAINMNSAVNMVKTNELLQKTQEQASVLQVQQEELRVANEELTEHAKVLTENEKRLQVQQEELRVANEELEERTRQLEHQKEDIISKNRELNETKTTLEQNADQLQRASQYKSEFLANMSHELRTPLNSLLILSNLLSKNKKGNLTADQVQSAQIIYKSGNDLLTLINEVLDLSKIEAGKMTIEFGMVNPAELAEEIVNDFGATAEGKGLSLGVDIAPGFPIQIETDRYRLMQIIRNLLSNAFKFTTEGKVSVEFKLPPTTVQFNHPGLLHGNVVCIRVEDSGVGIPAEKLDAIFEAFQQADGSISRKFGGTGLGLSISRGLIQMLGGEIQLESRIDQGSVFYVYLPVNRQSIPTSAKQSQEVSALIDAVQAMPNDKTINERPLPLFIDDDRKEAVPYRAVMIIHSSKTLAEKFMMQVRAKNYPVIVAATIPDAILLAETYHPRAIMLSVDLGNDKASYALLKSHPMISKLPIHMINPIEPVGSDTENELRTVETTQNAEAIQLAEADFLTPSKKILIVEDDPSTRKIIRALLSELDITIVEAGYAQQAYQILSQETFDCVILDLGLPDYSGRELLEKLKTSHIGIPKVIIYTGREISKEEHKNLSAYTNAIILKGLKSDERLMDEVTLFLHQVSKTIPDHKINRSAVTGDEFFRGKKILVVDDEIRNVFAMGKILEEHDMEVLEAENGEVAIALLKSNPGINLVLMDIMMPVMDGFEAMRIIRKTPEIRHVPIICLTAKAMKEDYDNALKNGADDYLSKPVNEEKLFAMLKIWLNKK